MSLPFLVLTPDANGYQAIDGNTVVNSGPLDGGLSRSRADVVGASVMVNVQWTLDPLAYEYAQAFKRNSITNGADVFQIKLIFDEAQEQLYTVKLVPGTWKLASQSGATYVIAATLEVSPQEADPFFDASIVALYTAYGEGSLSILDLLSDLINIDFPNFI